MRRCGFFRQQQAGGEGGRKEGGGWLGARLVLTFVVEAVDAVDGRALVVATKEEKVLRVFDLVGEQQADGFEALFP